MIWFTPITLTPIKRLVYSWHLLFFHFFAGSTANAPSAPQNGTLTSRLPTAETRHPGSFINLQHYHMIQTRSDHHHAGTPHVSSTRAPRYSAPRPPGASPRHIRHQHPDLPPHSHTTHNYPRSQVHRRPSTGDNGTPACIDA